MTSYDDAEGNKDQGLEVVVIPYRPSPPPRPPRPPPRQRRSPTSDGATSRSAALGSPASDESKACDDDTLSPPPPPNKQLMFTPRSRAAMAEAMGQEALPPPPPPTESQNTTTTSVPQAEKPNNQKEGSKKVAPVRSHSAGRSSAARSHSDAGASSKKAHKSTPPRVRSRSSPASGKKSSRQKGIHKKPSFYQMAKIGYQELCNAIIRPPRSNYPLEALGPEEFVFCGEKFVRRDFGVVNERGLLLECSMWKRVYDDDDDEDDAVCTEADLECQQQTRDDDGTRAKECGQITLNVDDWDENQEKGRMYLQVPETSFEDESLSSSFRGEYEGLEELEERQNDDSSDDSPDPSGMMNLRLKPSDTTAHTYYRGNVKTRKRRRQPVVIYLHGNSSGRAEAVPQLGHLLSLGVSVVTFDFAGSGRSEGEYVSLGYYEREDLQTVIHHLRASGDVSTIALWGRSMGAATAIMYGSRDPTISCMILDSSFTDLTTLAEEMVERGKEQGVNIPNFVVSVALKMIKSSIKSQAGFSIRHLSPISHVNRCFIPAMFVAGEHDQFINKSHSERLHAKYAGDKNYVAIDGDHNSPRPRFLLQSASLFLQSCMQLSPSSELVVPLGTNLLAPPWIGPAFNKSSLGAILAKARAEASASASRSDGRSWLPVNDTQQTDPQSPPRLSRGDSALDTDVKPPGLPLNQDAIRSRSCTDADPLSPTGADFLVATAPPDMSERQKEIQSSLFKMLGQQE